MKKMISITLVMKKDDEKDTKQDGQSKSDDNTKEEQEENKGEATHHAKVQVVMTSFRLLKAITDDSFTQNQDKLLDETNKVIDTGKIPTPNFKDGVCFNHIKLG